MRVSFNRSKRIMKKPALITRSLTRSKSLFRGWPSCRKTARRASLSMVNAVELPQKFGCTNSDSQSRRFIDGCRHAKKYGLRTLNRLAREVTKGQLSLRETAQPVIHHKRRAVTNVIYGKIGPFRSATARCVLSHISSAGFLTHCGLSGPHVQSGSRHGLTTSTCHRSKSFSFFAVTPPLTLEWTLGKIHQAVRPIRTFAATLRLHRAIVVEPAAEIHRM